MDLLGLARRQDQLKRITEIARVLRRYDLADWIRKIPSGQIRNLLTSDEAQAMAERPWEERVRLALTELGTTFIKLGQILSTRADLVDPELAKELAKLQAGTPSDPPEVVGGTIEVELGQRARSTLHRVGAERLRLGLHRPGPSGRIILGAGGRCQGPARRHRGPDTIGPRPDHGACAVDRESRACGRALPAGCDGDRV